MLSLLLNLKDSSLIMYNEPLSVTDCSFVSQVGREENLRKLPPSLLEIYSKKDIQHQIR